MSAPRPSVGRIVHLHEVFSRHATIKGVVVPTIIDQLSAAIIVAVNDDDTVNLTVFRNESRLTKHGDHKAVVEFADDVRFGAGAPPDRLPMRYWCWPPREA